MKVEESKRNKRDEQRPRPYERPEIVRVRLEADQVLGVGCKMGSDSASLITTCVAGGCSGEGS